MTIQNELKKIDIDDLIKARFITKTILNFVEKNKNYTYSKLKRTLKREIEEGIDSDNLSIDKKLDHIIESQNTILDRTDQLIEMMDSQFRNIILNQEKIDQYLFEKLGPAFEKIKMNWEAFKNKKMSSRELITESTKLIGNRFAKTLFEALTLFK